MFTKDVISKPPVLGVFYQKFSKKTPPLINIHYIMEYTNVDRKSI